MGKGDHVFNNVVAKLTKAFDEGLSEYFGATRRKLRGAKGSDLAVNSVMREDWMRRNMPRTWEALDHFKRHPELVTLRERLQTSEYQGGDVNNDTYSKRSEEFRQAVASFFWKLARHESHVDGSALLSDVRSVRRTFLHMTAAAEDPGAAQRLLDEYKDKPRERAKLEADISLVRGSLEWAWGRCDYLFRMAVQEHLPL